MASWYQIIGWLDINQTIEYFVEYTEGLDISMLHQAFPPSNTVSVVVGHHVASNTSLYRLYFVYVPDDMGDHTKQHILK